MKLINAFVLISLLGLASCASHDHVRAGADGIHRVVIRGTEKEEVERLAIAEAESFCDERKLAPAFTNEETKYTGSMSESTHKTLGKVSKAAGIGGAMMGVMGGKKERNVGQGAMGAGAVTSVLQDEDAYTADMKFKCI